MVTIGVEISLSTRDLYEHQCLENINKLYRYYCIYYYKQQYEAILEASIVSTTEGNTGNIPMSINMSAPENNHYAKKITPYPSTHFNL